MDSNGDGKVVLRVMMAADQSTRNVHTDLHQTVKEFKEVLANLTGFPCQNQWLVYNGHTLNDDDLLTQCGLKQDQTIYLVEPAAHCSTPLSENQSTTITPLRTGTNRPEQPHMQAVNNSLFTDDKEYSGFLSALPMFLTFKDELESYGISQSSPYFNQILNTLASTSEPDSYGLVAGLVIRGVLSDLKRDLQIGESNGGATFAERMSHSTNQDKSSPAESDLVKNLEEYFLPTMKKYKEIINDKSHSYLDGFGDISPLSAPEKVLHDVFAPELAEMKEWGHNEYTRADIVALIASDFDAENAVFWTAKRESVLQEQIRKNNLIK